MKPILEIQNISKKFRIHHENQPYLSLRDSLTSVFKKKTSTSEEFYALKDVSFTVNPGESVGIIGRNGAGKSTLLKILSSITPPSSGRVVTRGRIASLLEVGTGFHPELTGRENVFLNGSILGMRRHEILKNFDAIVDFAGVEKFIDTPLKHYSSGMQLRLAFAVAAFLENEILIIDEVLAVGDAEFQKKCMGKMEEVSTNQGRTVLFVSHNMAAVQTLCKKGLMLDKGSVILQGNVIEIVQHYFSFGIDKKNKPPINKFRHNKTNDSPVVINDIYVKGSKNEIPSLSMEEIPEIIINMTAIQKIEKANISLVFFNSEGIKTDLAFSWDDNFYLTVEEGNFDVGFFNNHLSLPPGRYTIGVGLNQTYHTVAWDVILHYPIFEIENKNNILNWDFRPWAIHHSKNNTWKLITTNTSNI